MGRTGPGVVHTISVAAGLARLHPQTLRLYEHEGLLSPGPPYSTDDFGRLHQIMVLTSDG